MMNVKHSRKEDARPLDVLLPGMKVAKVWVGEGNRLEAFEVKEPMFRNIVRIEVGKDGSITKAVDTLSGNVDGKLASELHRQVKEVMRGLGDDGIRLAREKR